MKAEERKTLEKSVLGGQLHRAYETVKQGPSRNTLVYGAIVLVGVGVIALFWWFFRSSEALASKRWIKLDDVVFVEQLEEVIADKELKETPQGRFLRFRDARVNLSLGLEEFGSNPASARKRIEKARDEYEELLKSTGRLPLLQQEALMGAAKANEALGEIEEAVKYYKKLITDFPDSNLAADAKKQQDRLDSAAGGKEARELANSFKPKQ